MKKYSKILLTIAVIAAVMVGAYFVGQKKNPLGISGGYQRTSYDVIGTASASSSLTTVFSDTRKTLTIPKLENLHLDIQYTPSSTNNYAHILVEGSNDEGTTWFPMSTKVIGTTEIDMFVEDGSGNVGIPIIIPGDKTSVATTQYSGMIDFDIVAEQVRISAKENSAASSTIYIRGTFTSQ